jgi:DNA-binding CsgD family transcriptional regulator
VLVGRTAEKARIDAVLAEATAGRGGALVVRGEPGIGKSALLGYADEQAAGMRVLHARGIEAEAELPFSSLYELLRPLEDLFDEIPERQAAALRGAFGLGPPLAARLLIGAGTLSLLAAAAEERPVLCLVDDAHWVDAASADALRFAARRLEADPVAVLFAAREHEPGALEQTDLPELALQGLEQDEAYELLAGAGLAESVVAELHRAASGNPLALIELPGALSERQRAGDEPLSEPLPATKALQAAYARRIEALPEATQAALLVAAAEPSGDLVQIAAACNALGSDLSALAPAEDAGLVAIVDARVVFSHPLVASGAYHGSRAVDRRSVHAALADAGADSPSRQAWHLAAAAAGPDERVAAALEDAARVAYARSGYRSAAAMLERAAALTPETAARAERLYLSAVMHFYDHGIARALALLEELDTMSVAPADRARFRFLRLALSYYRDPQRAATLLLEESRGDGDPHVAARAAALAACFRATIRDSAGALEAAQQTSDLMRRLDGDGDVLAAAGAGIGFVAAGHVAEAHGLPENLAALFQAREWRYEHPDDWVQGYSGVFAGAALMLLGEHDALRQRVESLASEFVPGDEVSLMLASGLLGTAHYFGGRWTEARARLSESLRIANEIGWLGPQVHAYARVLARLAAAQGAEDEARRQEEAAAPYAGTEWAGFTGAGALALLALGRREYAEAITHYEADVLPAIGPLVLYHDVADAAEAYLSAGRLDDARPWLERFAAQAGEAGWPWAIARAAHLEAVAAPADEYEDRFDGALEWHDRARQPFLRARTELAYGERLRRDGQRLKARDQLRPAVATFEALGAVPWADRAAAALLATGEHVRRRNDPDTSQLTPQELQVALLVARGATNKEAAGQLFLSPKTIEKRLGSTYAKLGLRSRSELARVFAEHEPKIAA